MNQTFSEFVQNSTLPKEDKDFWMNVLATLTKAQVDIFKNFADGKEDNLKILIKNIKAKEQAFRNSNENALEEIVRNEQ